MNELPWDQVVASGLELFFVTLTYGREFPNDGRQVAGHLQAFKARWQHRYGSAIGAWKLEFQRRGAAHYHLLLAVPRGTDLVALRDWTATAWTAVAANGNGRLRVQVVPARSNLASYFVKYVGSEKDAQHVVPPEYVQVGRFWGIWGVKPQVQEVPVTAASFFAMRRVLHTARAKRSRRVLRRASTLTGLWVLGLREGSWDAFYDHYALGLMTL